MVAVRPPVQLALGYQSNELQWTCNGQLELYGPDTRQVLH